MGESIPSNSRSMFKHWRYLQLCAVGVDDINIDALVNELLEELCPSRKRNTGEMVRYTRIRIR